MKRIDIKYTFFMFLGFIAFFFTMKGLGLYSNLNLRALNILIHGTGAYLAMRSYRLATTEPFEFLSTFAVGFRTSMLAVTGFALFQFVYLQFLNPSFMDYVHQNAIMGNYLTPAFASLVLMIEGLGVSVFTSYVGMRLLTVTENVPPLS